MFDGYEREYCELSTGIARRVQNVESLSGGAPPPPWGSGPTAPSIR